MLGTCAGDISALNSFFIVTGYFLAEKICRLNARETTCPSLENAMKEATWDVLKRYRLIFPYFLVANRFGVYSACLCTTVGQRYNSVEFTADSGRFPVFTELWVFCSLHNRGAMVSFRNDFCGLGAVSAAAQALWLDCAGDPGSNPADTGRDPAELWFTGCPMYTSVWLG